MLESSTNVQQNFVFTTTREVIQGTNIPNLAYVPNLTLVGAKLPVGTFFPLHNDYFYPITPTIPPITSPSAKIAQILHSIKTLKPQNFKLNLPVRIGIASIAVVSLFAIYRHNIITPLIPSDCPKQTGDFISEGEEVLNYSQSFNKEKGTEYFAPAPGIPATSLSWNFL